MSISMQDAKGNYIGRLSAGPVYFVYNASGTEVGTISDIGGTPHVYRSRGGDVGFAYNWGTIAGPSGLSVGNVDKQGHVYSDRDYHGPVGKVDATGRKALFAGAALLLLLYKEEK